MVKHKILELETTGKKVHFFNIRPEVLDFVKESGVKDGIINIQSPHTTCSILFEEMVHDVDLKGDEFLQVDLLHGLNKIFPKQETNDGGYKYPGPEHLRFALEVDENVRADHGTLLNGDAHLRSSLIGASESFSIIDGVAQLGPYGYVYFIDFDTCRARKRKCIMTIIGE